MEVLTAPNNDELLIAQAIHFQPDIVVIGEEKKYEKVKNALASHPVKVFAGEKALEEVASMAVYDIMLAAIVGFAGLRPTLCAMENGRAVALAYRATVVVPAAIV